MTARGHTNKNCSAKRRIMKRIQMHHYFAAIIALSLYCSGIIHFWHDRVSPFFDHSAHYLVLPVILPFILYQETVHLTPAVRDFPYLMAVYPFYFATLLSPIAFIARRNRNRFAESGPRD
jgi:site-specific recombinase